MRTRRACKLLATIALVFAACTVTSGEPGPSGPPREGGAQPQPSTPDPAQTPTPTPDPAPTTPGPGIGQTCGSGGVCASGLSCVEYYGIAGPRGPKFTSCEIRCDSGVCPSGLSCTTIADGPGRVCREAVAQTPTPTQPEPAKPGVGQACAAGVCAAGLSCVEYYGIAGPRGPKFTSCEVKCAGKGSKCPSGQTCTTIADGPGSVCRPATAQTPTPQPEPTPEPASSYGASCAAGKACAAGLQCVEYYGIAGARGPKFESCEVKCSGKGKSKGCPKGTTCVTISDGPGSVCRPAGKTQLPGPSQQGEVR